MSSGVKVCDTITAQYNTFKISKTVRFYTYQIVNKKKIEVDVTGPRDATYDDFVKSLPENEARYGLIDLEFKSKDGRDTSKLVFIAWVPDSGSPMQKMLYSSSKEAIKTALPGVGIHINATDEAELDLEASILPVVKRYA